jgi:hypothetical protein
MDLTLSANDLDFVFNLLRGIGNLLSAMAVLVVRIISRTAPYVLICSLIGVLVLTIDNVDRPLPTWYLPANFGLGITLFYL